MRARLRWLRVTSSLQEKSRAAWGRSSTAGSLLTYLRALSTACSYTHTHTTLCLSQSHGLLAGSH